MEQLHHIDARVRGRYLTASPSGEHLPVFMGFHGYAESAQSTLTRMQSIPSSSEWLCCAVEGLHHFYNRSGEIVSSWMTSRDRELMIEDNIAYVDSIVEDLYTKFPCSDSLVYLGFSQGAAMAYRAAAHGRRKTAGLVILGGDVPPELFENRVELPPILLCRGEKDQWYTAAQFEQDQKTLRDAGVEVLDFQFEGGHDWSEPFLSRAAEFLRAIRA